MYTILVLETPTPLPSPQELPGAPERMSVIAGTRGALESMASLLAPVATVGLMVYGFKMMFRGVMNHSS